MSQDSLYPDFDLLDKLLRQVRVEFEHRSRQACKGTKRDPISWTGHQALIFIAANQDIQEHCTRASIAAGLGLTPATTSGLVAGLLRKRLVSETKDSKFIDGRRKQLRLTTKGRDAYHGVLVQRNDTVGAVMAVMGELQRKSFFRHVSAMCDAAEALHVEQGH